VFLFLSITLTNL